MCDGRNVSTSEKNLLINKILESGKRTLIYECNKNQLLELAKQLHLEHETNWNIERLRKLISIHLKASSETIKMAFCDLKQFDGTNWDAFEKQMECVIIMNNVKDEKKVPLLITKLSTTVFDNLINICEPVSPVKKSYEDLCTILKRNYCKTTSPMINRSEFRRRNQNQGENIEEYVSVLRKLAKKCNFTDIEDQIKEKFIEGITSNTIKFELLKNCELQLEELIFLAKSVEAAIITSNRIDQTPEHGNMVPMYNNTVQNKKNFSWKKTQTANSSSVKKNERKCFCCGKTNHIRINCTLTKKYCSECGRQGHIFKMCPQRGTRTTNVVSANVKQNNDDEVEDLSSLFEEHEVFSLGVSKVPPHYISLNLEGKNIDFQLDTGSDVTVIPLFYKKKWLPQKEISKCKIVFKNFDQSTTEPIGILKNVTVTYKSKVLNLNLFVGNNNMPCILGRDWLNQFNLWPPKLASITDEHETQDIYVQNSKITFENVSEAEQYIRKRFAEVFTPGWGDFKGEEIILKIKPEAKPKCLPVRRVPFALRDKVTNEIIRLLKNGRIEPVKHSQWGTPVVPILKPDGSVRLCGDYKLTLNPHLQVDHFPLPHTEEIFNTLRDGEYFCELDLKEAYLQAPLSKESQDYTVIVTELGTYKYKYLPYGVSTGPGSFQRLMSNKLFNIPNVSVFIDNIYLSGKNLNDMVKTLILVLTKLQECGFKLKPQKCKLFQQYIDVFGYRITKNCIKVIKENTEPLLKAPPPTNLTLLRSFLGKINYYSRFLKDMSGILAPLYNCTKNNKFQWTPQCQEAFIKIKKKLASAKSLRHYDPDLPLILTCDASDVGIGAVLSNRDKSGIVKPVAFASKKLSSAEQKYSTIDKEALAIVFGVTKFYNYTYGRSFELETDSAALMRIFGPTKSIPKMAAKRLQHYAIFLSAFRYKIRHIKTSENPADYISRTTQNDKEKINLNKICKEGEISNLNFVNESKMEFLDWKVIQRETKKDSKLSKILRYSVDGWPNKENVEKKLTPYYNRKDEISTDRQCLFWGYRIIIPDVLQEKTLKEIHKSHFGIVKMKEIARSYFWWPNLDKEIESVTKECKACLTHSKCPPKIVNPWPVAPSAWHRIHADFLGPFNKKMFLVIVDSYSKWVEAFIMNNITTNTTIEILKSLFARFGYPHHLVTDNGTSFTSAQFQEFCKTMQIKHTLSPPYHPATNGAAERFVETFKSHVTKIMESGHNMVSAMNLFLSDYRCTPQRSSGVTPARLMLGREIRSRFSLLRPPPISDKLNEAQVKQSDYASSDRKVRFVVGDKVIVKDYRKGYKPWILGIIVKESVPDTTYLIDVSGAVCKRHVNQMRPCSERVEIES